MPPPSCSWQALAGLGAPPGGGAPPPPSPLGESTECLPSAAHPGGAGSVTDPDPALVRACIVRLNSPENAASPPLPLPLVAGGASSRCPGRAFLSKGVERLRLSFVLSVRATLAATPSSWPDVTEVKGRRSCCTSPCFPSPPVSGVGVSADDSRVGSGGCSGGGGMSSSQCA